MLRLLHLVIIAFRTQVVIILVETHKRTVGICVVFHIYELRSFWNACKTIHKVSSNSLGSKFFPEKISDFSSFDVKLWYAFGTFEILAMLTIKLFQCYIKFESFISYRRNVFAVLYHETFTILSLWFGTMVFRGIYEISVALQYFTKD